MFGYLPEWFRNTDGNNFDSEIVLYHTMLSRIALNLQLAWKRNFRQRYYFRRENRRRVELVDSNCFFFFKETRRPCESHASSAERIVRTKRYRYFDGTHYETSRVCEQSVSKSIFDRENVSRERSRSDVFAFRGFTDGRLTRVTRDHPGTQRRYLSRKRPEHSKLPVYRY